MSGKFYMGYVIEPVAVKCLHQVLLTLKRLFNKKIVSLCQFLKNNSQHFRGGLRGVPLTIIFLQISLKSIFRKSQKVTVSFYVFWMFYKEICGRGGRFCPPLGVIGLRISLLNSFCLKLKHEKNFPLNKFTFLNFYYLHLEENRV